VVVEGIASYSTLDLGAAEILFPFFVVVEGVNDSRGVRVVIWSMGWIVGEGRGGSGDKRRSGYRDDVMVITCVGRIVAVGCATLVVGSICHAA